MTVITDADNRQQELVIINTTALTNQPDYQLRDVNG